MVSDIAQRASIRSALGADTGVELMEQGEVQQITSNTDVKVTVYSTTDGEPRQILRIDAERVLMKRRSDGRPAFWMEGMPGSAPNYLKGELKCLLDPEFDEKDGVSGFDRAFIDSLGLTGRTCNMMAPEKNNARFKSVFDRDDHMAKKHRRENSIIKDGLARIERQKAEDKADRATEAMLALASRAAPEPAPKKQKPEE